jgi:hypothetical protein
MNRLLLIAAAVLACTGAAKADQLPAVYLGQWCPSASEHYYPLTAGQECDEGNGETLTIRPNELVGLESGCRFRSIKTTSERWPNHTKPTAADWTPVMEIIARCDDLGSSSVSKLRLIYAKGTLRIEGKLIKRLKVDQ